MSILGSQGGHPLGDLAAIISDPTRYKAEIERLTALREEAESKLRAVSLESEADALRETARQELASANDFVVEARLKANELRKQVQEEVANVRADAAAEANRIIAQATLKLAEAEHEHQIAEEVRRAAERSVEEAQSARLAHESAARDHGVAKAKHDVSAQLHDEAKARLDAVAKQIAEALK